MSAPQFTVGSRAEILELLHSPVRTRDHASQLVGLRGTVVGTMRHGALALLALEGDVDDLPCGIRRWTVHPDDLAVCAFPVPAHGSTGHYRLGLSGTESAAVQHAVPPDAAVGLCGESARPLPVCGWSLPFLVTAARACSECARLATPDVGSS